MPKVSTCFHVTSTPFFMLAVPYQHASNPFLGADQGGIEWGGAPRDGLLGTMRQKAFNRNDLEREETFILRL